MDTLCGDCKELEYKYEYHFPHPEERYWYCKCLKKKLRKRDGILGGIRKNMACPKLGVVLDKAGGRE